MQVELEQLLILQDRAQKIRQVEAELRTLPQERKSLDAQTTAAAAHLEALKLRGRHLEVDKKNLELDVGTRSESIARLKTQQYETRKNDEFSAMGREIERYQKEISGLEDQELEIMEQAYGEGSDRPPGRKPGGERRHVEDAARGVNEGARRLGRESG